MVSPDGSVIDDEDASDAAQYSQDVIEQMKKDREVLYAWKCVHEYKEEAVERVSEVLSFIAYYDNKNVDYVVERIMDTAAFLVGADCEETDDEDAQKRPISTRLSLMIKNRDKKLSEAAASLLPEIEKRHNVIPSDANRQLDLVSFLVKIRIQMLRQNQETLKQS